ncbi:MAG: two-component system, NarL family, sensor kinase [Solirubrobacteraceae bacterium]|nr:two-component system, NarL family, sensor kinase [Solirubrobacteraceae bacterium]
MRDPSLPRLLLQFAATGLVAVLIVALAATYAFRRAGERESVRDARRVAQLIASTVIEPHLSDGIVDGDPRALARLDRAVRPDVIREPVVRIKLWTPDGRIVYSDERRLIGAHYRLDDEERAVLATGRVAADISDLSQPENRFERPAKKLLQVYLPVSTPGGKHLLFEAYLRFSSIAASGQRIWFAFAPALVAGLLLLWISQLPFALSLARRLRDGQRERESLLLRSLDASDTERRRIASDLHDGVVQHLAGTSFSLAGVAEHATDPESRAVLRDAATSTRRAVRELRSLLVEIYPPNLRGAGLDAALSDLLARAAARGATTDLRIDEGLSLSSEQEQLVFRAVQEALRNVAAHADASEISVSLELVDGTYELTVTDDGRGFDQVERDRRRERAHVGLDLLADRARDLGSTLTLASTPGTGTRLTLRGPRS